MEKNRVNLIQVEQTTFGTGKGYEIVHGGDRLRNMEKIFSGDFMDKFGDREVDKWVEHLNICYNEERLQRSFKILTNPLHLQNLYPSSKETERVPNCCQVDNMWVTTRWF